MRCEPNDQESGTYEDLVLAKTISKATWRLVPFLPLMYILAFLDRANVGFAKQSFQLDTGLSEAAYASPYFQ